MFTSLGHQLLRPATQVAADAREALRARCNTKPLHCFMATRASVCNLPMKQACAFEDKTEFQPTPDTTRWVPELPRTSLAYRHNETGRKRAR